MRTATVDQVGAEDVPTKFLTYLACNLADINDKPMIVVTLKDRCYFRISVFWGACEKILTGAEGLYCLLSLLYPLALRLKYSNILVFQVLGPLL